MKKNNKGFSLVELIIVIAIMAVLVGVLAPQFIKYVEQSRKSRDIQTAQEIREAVLADLADGVSIANTTAVASGYATAINDTPTVSSKDHPGATFGTIVDTSAGTCQVYVSDDSAHHDLCTTAGASWYKSH
jgi:prepilin-type N-terminal cleavage/methylation domain-containing protein